MVNEGGAQEARQGLDLPLVQSPTQRWQESREHGRGRAGCQLSERVHRLGRSRTPWLEPQYRRGKLPDGAHHFWRIGSQLRTALRTETRWPPLNGRFATLSTTT